MEEGGSILVIDEEIKRLAEELGFDIVEEDEMDGIHRCKNCGVKKDTLGFTDGGLCSICSYNIAMYNFHKKYCV